jgi:hypothetical protein
MSQKTAAKTMIAMVAIFTLTLALSQSRERRSSSLLSEQAAVDDQLAAGHEG